MADHGFQETASLDPLLHYKFLLLKADITSCTAPQAVLAQLDAVSPELTKHGDLEAERKYVEAGVYGCQQNFNKVEESLRDAEKLAKQNRPELMPNIVYFKAWVDKNQHNPRQEEEDYLAALDLSRQFNDPIEASSLGSLGLLYENSGRYREAIEKFSSAVEIARKWHDRLLEELNLGNLGNVYSALGDFANSEDYSKQAVDIAHQINEPADEEIWLINLGRAYQSDGRQQNREAEDAYARAVTIAHALHDNKAETTCIHNLAQLSLKRSDIAKAQDYTHRVEELHPIGVLAFFLELDHIEIAQAQKDFVKADQLLQRVVQAVPQPPFLLLWRFQNDLAKNYAAQGQDKLADIWFRKGLKTAEDQYARISSGGPQISFLDSAPFYSSYISFLLARNKTVEALAVAELGRSRTLSQAFGKRTPGKALADIKRVQSRLKPGKEVVLAYFLTDNESYLWAITHAGIRYFSLPSLKELYEKIHAYNKEIQDLVKLGDSANAVSLYKMLVTPAEKLIPPGALVTVVPNRYLYYLNFDTLVVPGSVPHYWIEDVNIQVCNALTLLANSHRESSPASMQLLLIGAPVQAKGGPRTLQHAEEEVERVASHFSDGQKLVIKGSHAVPEAYLGGAPERFRFIHFAAHGIASQNRPLESAIILSPDPAGQYKLGAPDIIKLKIHPDLVTISSCESAGTRTYDAEGLVGLGWAFMRAGAHSVVAGLWDVDDASSPILMDEFYNALSKGKYPADALRIAKLAMLHSDQLHSRPYYWAALQLYTGS